MNLQVCVPYEKCPFNCPTCIASGRENFENLFDKDHLKYVRSLEKTSRKSSYDSYILTGGTEPTLNSHWVKTVLNVLKDKHTELQTRNYNLKGYNLKHLNVLAYSITDAKGYLSAWQFRKIKDTNRLVILLTKEFNFLTAENFNTMGFDQITFKVLQHSGDKKVNEYIDNNSLEDLTEIYKIVQKFNGSNISVRLDANCQDSHGRYEIFRENGLTYADWSSTDPID